MTFCHKTSPSTAATRSHKRRRSDVESRAVKDDDCCATTSGESSDESDSFEFEEAAQEAARAAKRQCRAELDGLKKSVRRMEAQVVDASAQLRDLAALVAQVVAQRQQQQQHLV